MIGHTHVAASHLTLITDQAEIEAAKNNDLYIDGKIALIVRGIPTQDTIRSIYTLFSTRHDMTGSPFRLSHKEKGIVHKDQWSEYSKLDARSYARYLEHFAVLMELIEYRGKPALVVVPKLHPMLTQLFHQPRYLEESMLSAFQWID
jgi:hypothetical protein